MVAAATEAAATAVATGAGETEAVARVAAATEAAATAAAKVAAETEAAARVVEARAVGLTRVPFVEVRRISGSVATAYRHSAIRPAPQRQPGPAPQLRRPTPEVRMSPLAARRPSGGSGYRTRCELACPCRRTRGCCAAASPTAHLNRVTA